MFEIADYLGFERISTSRGSTVPKKFMTSVAEALNANGNLRATEILREILNDAGVEWNPTFDSEMTPSGGGETITLEGLVALERSVKLILESRRIEQPLQMTSATILAQDDWTIIPGQRIVRRNLHDKYGGVRQGGISPSSATANIFLFFDRDQAKSHGYTIDDWDTQDDAIFEYSAEGQSGDQDFSRYNKSVLDHRDSKKSLRLFEGVRGNVEYIGEFELADPKFRIKRSVGRDGIERNAIVFRLRLVGESADRGGRQSGAGLELVKDFEGSPYKWVAEVRPGVALSDPFTNDPDALDRATLAHGMTQNEIAEWLTGAGIEPLSPSENDPPFDIAWVAQGKLFIGEVKSITLSNEIHQIRLGIGQVLDYCQQINGIPVLIVNDKPSFSRWKQVCALAGVQFFWVSELSINGPESLAKD